MEKKLKTIKWLSNLLSYNILQSCTYIKYDIEDTAVFIPIFHEEN